MLWPPANTSVAQSPRTVQENVRQFLKQTDPQRRRIWESALDRMRRGEELSEEDQQAIAELEEEFQAQFGSMAPRESFHPYQLLTHAFLHDNSSIFGFLTHLGGNLVFMLVFGSRVNALLGNIATLIIYPILAVGAAGLYLLLGNPHAPMLGASGAIMGLAGMYLILFPVHRVYCGMWLRIWLRFRTWLFMKVFVLRGFWVLLIYFGYDALMVALKVRSGTAHWAHIGGFLIGVTIALVLLTSRLFNCGGGDLLSVALGKYAWGIIGRPARWNRPRATATAALSPA
jgi:membrane associated rhomboid family serine protease